MQQVRCVITNIKQKRLGDVIDALRLAVFLDNVGKTLISFLPSSK